MDVNTCAFNFHVIGVWSSHGILLTCTTPCLLPLFPENQDTAKASAEILSSGKDFLPVASGGPFWFDSLLSHFLHLLNLKLFF